MEDRESAREHPDVGVSSAGNRLFVAVWLAALIVAARVTLQLKVDYDLEGLRGDLLREHAVEHLVLAGGRALIVVAAFALLPGGRMLRETARVLLAFAACVGLLAGWPGSEPQYVPALDSDRGRMGWAVIFTLAACVSLLNTWMCAPRRWYFRLSPAIRWATAAALLLLCMASAMAVRRQIERHREQIVVTRTDLDLLDHLGAATVKSAGRPVRIGSLLPSLNYKIAGGNKPAVVMPPPAEVEFLVSLDDDSQFSFSYCVDSSSIRPRKPFDQEVTFEVDLDGENVFSHTIEPAREPAHRHWFDHRIDLSDHTGNDVVITLRTRAVGELLGKLSAGFGRPLLQHSEGVARASRQDGFNVLLIVVDTLRADHLSCYGYPRQTSPFIDSLAEEGVLFENAFSTASWTWPAVASLLTGKYPPEHGVLAPDRCFLGDSLQSLPEMLIERGVTTAGWSSNPLICRDKNFDQGFEVWREFSFKPGELLTREFVDWLPRYSDYQFFAYLHYTDPHHPYAPPGEFRTAFADPDVDMMLNEELVERARAHACGEQAEVPDAQQTQALVDLYDGEIAYLDREIRRVCEALERHGLLDRTIVLLTSDHGEEFRDHGGFNHAWTLYRELLQVPLIIRHPEQGKPRRVADLVSITQIGSTVLEFMGASPPGAMGSPVLPPWSDGEVSSAESSLHWANTTKGIAGQQPTELFSVQNLQYKLIRSADGSWQRLFDLRSDPTEVHDLSQSDRPADQRQLAQFQAQIDAWLARCREGAVERGFDRMDPGTREQLEQFGYLDPTGEAKGKPDRSDR